MSLAPSKLVQGAWRLAVIVLLAGLLVVGLEFRESEEREEAEEAVAQPRQVHGGVVQLRTEQIERAGLQSSPATESTWIERVPLYGRVVANPKGTIDLRAPFAGVLQGADAAKWPQLGQHVAAGESLGLLDVRVGPQERVDLEAKLKEAQLRHQGALEVERIQTDRVERLSKLAASDIVSRREMADAQVALAEAQTQVTTTRAAVELWTKTMAQIAERRESVSHWRVPLLSPTAGEITQVLVRPGTQVEAGAPLVRIVNFRQVLVRLDVPAELLRAPPPDLIELQVESGAGVLPLAANDAKSGEPVEARLLGLAPQVDVTSQLTSYWYETTVAAAAQSAWRPGRFVTTSVTARDAKPQPAIEVSASALLLHEGQPWVYVQEELGRYVRRPVRLLGRDGQRCWLAPGISAGDLVVSHNAQVLLSEEFRTEGDDD